MSESRKSSQYPGDSDAKRLARALLYRRIDQLWSFSKRPEGTIITLCGDEATEIPSIRDYLKWEPEKTLFVDELPEGPKKVRKQWKAAGAFHGDIRDAVRQLKGPIAFANLDFMGYFTQDVKQTIFLIKNIIAPGGVVSYTFRRDREADHTPEWNRLSKRAMQIIKSDPELDRKLGGEHSTPRSEAVRMVGYSDLLKTFLEKKPNSYQEIYAMRYFSKSEDNNGNSMGIIALQNTDGIKNKYWEEELKNPLSEEEKVGYIRPTICRESLRHIAVRLLDSMSPKEVAGFLNLPRQNVAAWLAHKTRGTYDQGRYEEP